MNQLIFASILLAFFCLSGTADAQRSPEEISTVPFCDLVKNSSKYEGITIRVNANYYVQFETSILSDPSCKQEAWVEFDRDIESNTEPELWKRFHSMLGDGDTWKKKCKTFSRRKMIVTWTGTFKEAHPLVKTDDLTIVSKVGHMQAYDFEFTAHKVEEVGNLEILDMTSCW